MLLDKLPKISCVTCTVGRPDFLMKSIPCYLRQTYQNRELIVLSQGDADTNNEIRGYIDSLERADIHFLEAPADLPLGAMRNASIEIATGEVICQWDDDDLYHSERLRSQYNSLRSNNSVAALYSQFLKYFQTDGELFWCDWLKEVECSHKYLCGTIMFHKRFFHQYKSVFYPEHGDQCHVEEDLNVLEKLMSKGNVAPVEWGHQYLYVYHGENTYDLTHHQLNIDITWEKTLMQREELFSRRELLCNAFEDVGIDQPIRVRSDRELAFTYDPK